MNIKAITDKIKGLVAQGKDLAKDPEVSGVYSHVQLFAVLDLRLEETNKLLTEQNKLLTQIAAQTAPKEFVYTGPG